jgi:lysophospholipid acyltransferase (LPLAT)-like uncharacterized protein
MKKKILNFLQVNLVPFLVSLFVRFLYVTNKRVFHLPSNIPKKPFILAMWHGELLMMPLGYKKLKPNGKLVGVISEHRDGETIKRIYRYFGVDAVRGSSTRGGVKALINAISTLKQGIDVVITPDGPKGPRHQVANGIIAMAQKTNSPIMTYSFQPSRYWQMKSWDKFIVPKPFGIIHFYISEPFYVDNISQEEARVKIKSNMMKNITPDLIG